jgi:RHS repeat-associated protein
VYNTDVRGSVTGVIRPDGTRVTGYQYDEFGNVTKNSAAGFKNEVSFTGAISDDMSGLHYMNARYYAPAPGRFLQQDTYSGNPYDPWTQHLYTYCGNNPVNYIDPTGHFFGWLIGGIVGGFMAAIKFINVIMLGVKYK